MLSTTALFSPVAAHELKDKLSVESFSIPETFQEYFNTDAPKHQFFGDMLVWSVDNASNTCPGFDHPMVMAQAEDCIGWIHFVTVNSDPGISHSKQCNGVWLFVDVAQDQSEKRNPFYTQSDTFFDNPKWIKPLDGTLSWSGIAFPVICKNGTTYIGNGFSWGFEWNSSQSHPQAKQIKEVDSTCFKEYSNMFSDDFDVNI